MTRPDKNVFPHHSRLMDTVRASSSSATLSRTVFRPQPIPPPISSVPSPPVSVLYNTLPAVDMSMTESVSKIWSFVHSPSQITAARNFRGKEAQGLVDLIDKVRDPQS